MTITHSSIGKVSITEFEGLVIGKQVGVILEGVRPTFGATAEDMGFRYFFMTVNWVEPRKNRMIPMSEIDDDIKSLMSGVKWGER